MATKRFDDVAEKARALEAQAKKLRREAQAARTKAYADALVTVFPEVKDMGSRSRVRHGRARLGGQKAGVRRGRRSRPLAS